MSWVLYLFGSGQALFLGAAMVLLAVALLHRASGWQATALAIVARLGMFLAVISAVPLSYWLYALALVVTTIWLWRARRKPSAQTSKKDDPLISRRATAAIWLGIVLLELPYHFSPRLSPDHNSASGGIPPLYILGDSITAGLGSGEQQVWPDLLPDTVEVHNLARPGATAGAALASQCNQLPEAGGLVLVELGGNDLLGDTPTGQFERDLSALLGQVAAPRRTVLMFELPLPPLCNEYGRIQRRLAARHNVRLIPKRVLIEVLTGGDATLDSIHLTPGGHQRMAAAVWQIVRPAY